MYVRRKIIKQSIVYVLLSANYYPYHLNVDFGYTYIRTQNCNKNNFSKIQKGKIIYHITFRLSNGLFDILPPPINFIRVKCISGYKNNFLYNIFNFPNSIYLIVDCWINTNNSITSGTIDNTDSPYFHIKIFLYRRNT